MDDLEYKEAHEKFVSGLTGTTFEEIAYLLLIAPLSCLFHRAVITLLDPKSGYERIHGVVVGKMVSGTEYQTKPITLYKFLVDFSSFVLPMLICVIYSEHNHILMGFMLLFSILVGLFNKSFFCTSDLSQIHGLIGPVKTFITEYRSSMLISSFIMILAVDFAIFPRRFAKCETYGISLGTFLVANAVTSRLARGGTNQTDSRLQLFLKALRSVIQLIVIGSARAIAVKSTNYQEHVSEYGVHWNFFFTLACVTIIVAVLNLDIKTLFPVALSLLIGYQYALLNGLGEYIQDDAKYPRSNLFHANKEGIVSLIGYTVLSLSGSAIGYSVFHATQKTTSPRLNEWWIFLGKLIVSDVILWTITLLTNSYVEPTSRRMVNFSFVAALVAYNVWLLIFLLFVNLVTKPVENSVIQAANYNGLAMFMLANLGTGLVNMSMKTLYASDTVATAVLIAYLVAVCGIGVFLYNKKIQLKMW